MEEPVKDGENLNDIDNSEMIWRQYAIVKRIFEYLPIRELLICSQVSKGWNEVCQLVRKCRKNRCGLFFYDPFLTEDGHNLSLEFFFSLQHYENENDPSLREKFKSVYENHTELIKQVIVAMNSSELEEPSNFNALNSARLVDQIKNSFMERLKQCYFESQMVVAFGSEFHGSIAKEALLSACLSSIEKLNLPPEATGALDLLFGPINPAIPKMLAFSDSGIVATNKENTKSYEIQEMKCPHISALFIPKVTGLKIKKFSIDNSQRITSVSDDKFLKLVNIEATDNVKGIVLLTGSQRLGRRDVFFNALQRYIKENVHVALAGGVFNACAPDGKFLETDPCTGLIICGDDNVKVASIGFLKRKMPPIHEEKLIKMKATEHPKGDSFAFMFACEGRGTHMHKDRHVEVNLFRKHFPKTSLVGAFTGGEYCHEVIPDAKYQHSDSDRLKYQYSTVFLFVSYFHPENKQKEI